jgi:hypothetical protein
VSTRDLPPGRRPRPGGAHSTVSCGATTTGSCTGMSSRVPDSYRSRVVGRHVAFVGRRGAPLDEVPYLGATDVCVRPITFLSDWPNAYLRAIIQPLSDCELRDMKPSSYDESLARFTGITGHDAKAKPHVTSRPRSDNEDPGPSLFRTLPEDGSRERMTLSGLFVGRSELSRVAFTASDLHLSTICWNDFTQYWFDRCDLADSCFPRLETRRRPRRSRRPSHLHLLALAARARRRSTPTWQICAQPAHPTNTPRSRCSCCPTRRMEQPVSFGWPPRPSDEDSVLPRASGHR